MTSYSRIQSLVNQKASLSVSVIPEDPVTFFGVKADGKELDIKAMKKLTITIDGKMYPLAKIRDAVEIPMGAEMKFFFPAPDAKKGEDFKVDIHVPQIDANIELTRKIY